MNLKKDLYARQAQTIVKAFEKRQIEGYYCETGKEASDKVMELIRENSVVALGGSATVRDLGLVQALEMRGISPIDHHKGATAAEVEQLCRQGFSADYYLMSSNAVTLDGKLVNMDALGNRVAALIYGPKNVIVVAGMNKVALDEAAAIARIRNVASPMNTIRLDKKTPCTVTGKCHDCLSEGCLCTQMVVTRMSRVPNRIKVILVGEELGF